MKAQSRILLGAGIGFVALMIAGWAFYFKWRAQGREEAAVAFSSLAVCLAGGPERVPPEAASRHARLLHYETKDPSLVWCVPFKNALISSRYVRMELGDLAHRVEEVDLGPFDKRPIWRLEELWNAGESLPWQPPSTLGGEPISKPPVTLVDSLISTELKVGPFYQPVKLDIRLDPYPFDRIAVGKDGSSNIVITSSPGEPFAKLERVSAEKTPPEPHRTIAGVIIASSTREKVTFLEDTGVWIKDKELHLRRLSDKKDTVVDLPSEAGSYLRSCRAPKRRILAVELFKGKTLALYEIREGSITSIGHIDEPGGNLSMNCDDDVVRVGWASPEPSGRAISSQSGAVDLPPGGHQRIYVATCSKGSCTQKETRIELNVGWGAKGGFGADWYMMAAEVQPVGERVLIVWEGRDAIFYLFAPIEELNTTPKAWFAEASSTSIAGLSSPFSIVDPELTVLLRGGAALVRVTGQVHNTRQSLFVRFTPDGNATALPLPERGK